MLRDELRGRRINKEEEEEEEEEEVLLMIPRRKQPCTAGKEEGEGKRKSISIPPSHQFSRVWLLPLSYAEQAGSKYSLALAEVAVFSGFSWRQGQEEVRKTSRCVAQWVLAEQDRQFSAFGKKNLRF